MNRLIRSALGIALVLGLWLEGPGTAVNAQKLAPGPSEAQLLGRVAAEPGKAASHLDLALFYYRASRRIDTEQAVTAAIERVKADRAAQIAAHGAAPAPALPRVGIDVPEPGKTKDAAPKYPAAALKAGVIGCVVIDAVIDKEGRVKNARVVRSVPKLDKAATDVVRQWRFVPTVKDGRLIDVAVMFSVSFMSRADFAEDLACAGFSWDRGQFELAQGALSRALVTLGQERVWLDAYGPGAGATNPVLVRAQKPQYTQAAMDYKIQGIAEVEAVVLEDGTVGAVRIRKSLDAVEGLDAEALIAAKQFIFRPALLNGKPVLFKVIIQLEFRLH